MARVGASGSSTSVPSSSRYPIRYWNGALVLAESDLDVPAGGIFGHERFYCNQLDTVNYGANGCNWFINQMPYAVQNPVDSTVAIVFDPNNPFWFDYDRTTGVYTAKYGTLDVTLVGTGNELIFTQTANGQVRSATFIASSGAFRDYTDANGVLTRVQSRNGTQIAETQRVYVTGGVMIVESLQYAYFGMGGAAGALQSVTYRRQIGGGNWTPIQQVSYSYYGTSAVGGNVYDLRSATQQLPNGTGGWNDVAVSCYRYYLPTDPGGFTHGLKMKFGPEASRLMFNDGVDIDTAADADVKPYADNYYEYDGSQRVTLETSAVCAGCPGGGTTSDSFSYTAGPGGGYSQWAMKTIQTLPDGSQIVVYTNIIGLPVLYVAIDSSGANMWGTFYRYNDKGKVFWQAMPSAVALPASLSTLEAYSDLLNYNATTHLYQYLNNTVGLIHVTDYFGETETPTGYVKDLQVQQGQQGTPVKLRSFTYGSQTDSGGNTIRPVASVTDYVDGGTPAITSFSYLWYAGTGQPSQVTTTLPAVSASQNGDGTSPTTIETYDAYTHMTQFTDERGIVNNYTFDGLLGLMSEQVLNYQSGVTQPGVNLTTDYAYDIQGRLTQTLGPSHTVDLSGTATTVRPATWYVYLPSVEPISGAWDVDQTWIGSGYAAGTGPSYTYTLIDPVMIARTDKDGRSTDQITSHRTSGSGALSPTDTFAQTDWQTWSTTQYDDQHRTISRRVYFLIPTSGSGTIGTNYGETDLGYDALERLNRVQAPGGTIARTVWTAPQRVASIWVGTNDTGATDSNPAGSGSPNNMVMVSQNQYDGGSAGGDGNLTQLTQYASPTDTRVTTFGYDWRNRNTSMTDALSGYVVFTYDNLDRRTMTQRYAISGGNLIAQNGVNYDARGRVYQQLVYAVDPSTGTVGNSLVGNSWYDYSGNRIQWINPGDGQRFIKNAINGVGWITATYTGYNPTGTSFSQAQTDANDIILEQVQNTFDEVGNVVSVASFQRLNDAPSSGTGSTGALSYGTQPKARVSYAASWFDGIDRQIATANYGAVASFTRPSTPPSSSATVLVNTTSYNQAGQPSQTTDPMGYVTQTSYDNAQRKTQTVEDYGTGLLNRTTNWIYTLDNLVASMTAVNSTTGNQTTTWSYGTILSTSGVARNDLPASVAYPDSVSGSDAVSYAYNALGQPATITDQRGTVRTIYRDKLGRQTDDSVSTVGSSTDSTVLRISTAYEVRGMIASVTSYNNATPGSGTALNQCALTYNTFAQLSMEQQDHNGTVSGSSPSVQYGYDSGASGSNEVRLNGLTYPNGRAVAYNFASGMDSAVNRVTSISDTSATLAGYTYLGLGMVVRISYPQPGVWLDLWGGSSSAFAGLDQFNRVIDQRWQNNITGTAADIDRYQYGYDQNSNRLYKANVVGTPVVAGGLDEYYAYDHLNRLTDMQRGTLNSGKTGITGTPSGEQSWSLDPTGNWSGFITKASGTTNLNQTRTSNAVNEITNVTESTGPAWIVPTYDAAGNTATMPQVVDPTLSFNALHDAWNRMTSISSGGSAVATYAYDGRNRRIVKTTPTETRHLYFTNDWRDIGERAGTATSMDKQFVWGIRYVDELVCRDDATPTRLYSCQDANFNLTAITDSSGNVQERYLFDPYGSRTVMSASWSIVAFSAFGSVVGLQGLIYDAESGLIYARMRHWHPALGAWGQRDHTIFFYIDGLNLYAIEVGAPTTRQDPFGRRSISNPYQPPPPPPYTPDPIDNVTWGQNGRAYSLGPQYGNWGGKDWSGGWVPSQHGGAMGTAPAIDSSDELYEAHDKCYDAADKSEASCLVGCLPNLGNVDCPVNMNFMAAQVAECNARCNKAFDTAIGNCNAALVAGLRALSSDPGKWPRPPRGGFSSFNDAAWFRQEAIDYFGGSEVKAFFLLFG